MENTEVRVSSKGSKGHRTGTGKCGGGKQSKMNLGRFRRKLTSVLHLPNKPTLKHEARINCQITSVTNPGEFYIRCEDVCRSIYETLGKDGEAKFGTPCIGSDVFYYDGRANLELTTTPTTDGFIQRGCDPAETFSITESLKRFMGNIQNLKKLNHDFYVPNHELVAVKMGSGWMRAIVLPTINERKEESGKVKVQLLDTGEKVKVVKKDMCALPESFSLYPAEAYRCCIFGVSPVGFVWNPFAIEMFQSLPKEAVIIIKNRLRGSTSTFETMPYVVQLLVDEGHDVAEKLIEANCASRWSPNPTWLGKFTETNAFRKEGLTFGPEVVTRSGESNISLDDRITSQVYDRGGDGDCFDSESTLEETLDESSKMDEID